MNIFKENEKKITDLIKKNKNTLGLNVLGDFKSINIEIPPSDFDYDLSCNVCLVLGKILSRIGKFLRSSKLNNSALKPSSKS